MSFQAYLDSVKAKTGKTPADFKALAAEKGLTKHGEIVAWLKSDFGLGHGHANAVTQVILHADKPKVSRDEKVDNHFMGGKGSWRPAYDDLLNQMQQFGPDVAVAPTSSYISILRNDKKFAVVQVTTNRLDIGIKLPGTPVEGRFEESGRWNAMVTHRIRIDAAEQIDAEVLERLRQAYERA